jgi:hypothetical protein
MLAGAAQPAVASTGTPSCTASASRLRYQPVVTYTCDSTIGPTSSFAVTRVSSGATLASPAVTYNGTTATVEIVNALSSAAQYRVSAQIDDGGLPVSLTTTWTTMPAPAHPNLSIEYITAIPDPAAVHDMLQRIDGANLFAPPAPSRWIDASSGTMTVKQLETALTGRQAVLVVGGPASFAYPGNLGAALAWFASKGHGVVTAGQTHWIANSTWPYNSAVGQNTVWDSKWDIYGNDDLIDASRIHGGAIAASTIRKHFITAGLKSFTVVGPSSGEVAPHFITGSQVLAYFPKTSSGILHQYPQAFLTERQVGASRLVDLGYRPWSSAITGGGFNPAVSPGGTLLSRALWWSMNRIAPTKTHFTKVPPKHSAWATVTLAFGATDPDLDHVGALRFRYRLDGGTWKWAVANSVVFYNLPKGRYHTVSVYSQDSGGNRDPRTASYRFFVNSNARS